VRHLIAFFGVMLSLGACHGSGRREATSLDDGVDRYRRAEGAQRMTELQAVTDLPCSIADVCDAKKTCLEAMAPTARALDLKDEVTRALGELQDKRLAPDAAAAQALPAMLDEATRLLEVGRAKMGDCERKLADLRLRYGR
jgi:hypothetical protein